MNIIFVDSGNLDPHWAKLGADQVDVAVGFVLRKKKDLGLIPSSHF